MLIGELEKGCTLSLVEHVDGFEDGITHDFQALGAQLVHGVLRGVMEDVVVAVIEVDYVGARNAALDEGKVIVVDGALAGVEVGLIPQALGGGVDEIEQPGSAVGVADDVEVGVGDHVHYQERFDLLQRAVFFPFLGEMARAVKTISAGPSLDRFFAVGPDEPNAAAIAFFAAQLVGVFEQDGGGRAAIVGADVSGIAQRVVGVVVAEDDDDAVSSAGKFGDDVADGKLPFHGVGGKGVVFYLIAFEVVVLEVIKDVALEFLVILAAHVARAESGDLAGVLDGPFGIDVRERGVVGNGGFGQGRGRRFDLWRKECLGLGIRSTRARNKR